MIWAILGAIAFLFLKAMGGNTVKTETPSAPAGSTPATGKKVFVYTNSLWDYLKLKLPPAGALLAYAQAVVECGVSNGQIGNYGYNFWNFGEPGWWKGSSFAAGTGTKKIADDVGAIITFPSIEAAIDGYIEIMRRGRPTAYAQLISKTGQLSKFLESLCPARYGKTGNPYATACDTHYPDSIADVYERYSYLIT